MSGTESNSSSSQTRGSIAKKKLRKEDLFTQIQFLKGVGPDRAELFKKLQVSNVVDLLFLFPRKYEDFTTLATPDNIVVDANTSLLATVLDFEANVTRTGKYIISAFVEMIDIRSSGIATEATQAIRTPSKSVCIEVTWFNQEYLARKLERNQTVFLQGVVKQDEDRFVMTQPKINWISAADVPDKSRLLPVYPLTEKLTQERMRQVIKRVAEDYSELLDEVFPDAFLKEQGLLGITQAVRQIHLPENQEEVDQARHRLIFQELFVQQSALAMRRKHLHSKQAAPSIELTPQIRSRIKNRFPFELTESQLAAIDEIVADMKLTIPMNRLLHGEVGSGKTAVAAFAILLAVAQGFQAVLMAPTEILVEQHINNLNTWLAGSRVEIASWTGALTERQRVVASRHIRDGKTGIVIGTNALAVADLEFANLGIVVIDEQHKFGVRQRAQVRSVGGGDPHYLVMTATPIPRTISMTLYGDLDVSTLNSRRTENSKIHTYFGSDSQRDKWWSFFRKKLEEGRQGYVIAPLVDSENENLASVEHLFEALTNGPLEAFRVDLMHGRLKSEEKLQIMHAFARGHTQVLVATSVVEVGVDVPNATVMTIESAERFGLSQLHQLRGRVARGQHPGFVCAFPSPQVVLNDPDGATERRLQAFVNSADGFELAEVDLQIRGPGDFFSNRQHGFPPLMIADLSRDQRELFHAREAARNLIEKDPQLQNLEFAKLKKMIIGRYGRSLELSDVG